MAVQDKVLDVLKTKGKDQVVYALNELEGIEQITFNDVVDGKKLLVHALDLDKAIGEPKIVELLGSKIGGDLAGPQPLVLAGYGIKQGWFVELMKLPRLSEIKININWDFPNECSLKDMALMHGQLANLLKYADGFSDSTEMILNPVIFDGKGNAKSDAEMARLPHGTAETIPLCVALHQNYPGSLDDNDITSRFLPLTAEYVVKEVIPSIKQPDDSFEIYSKLPKAIDISPSLEIGVNMGNGNIVHIKILDLASKYGKLQSAIKFVDGKIPENMMIANPEAFDGKGNQIVDEGQPTGAKVGEILKHLGVYDLYKDKLLETDHQIIEQDASSAAAGATKDNSGPDDDGLAGELAKMILSKESTTNPGAVVLAQREFKILPKDENTTKIAPVALALLREGSFENVVDAGKLEGPIDISGKEGIAILYHAIKHKQLDALAKQGIVGELEDFHTIAEQLVFEKEILKTEHAAAIDAHSFEFELITLAAKQGLLQDFLDLMLQDVGQDSVSNHHLKFEAESLANQLNLGATVNPESRFFGKSDIEILLDHLDFTKSDDGSSRADSTLGFFYMTQKLAINVLVSMLKKVSEKLKESIFFKTNDQGGLGLWLDSSCVDTSKEKGGEYEIVYRAVTQVTKPSQKHTDPIQTFFKFAVELDKLVTNHEAASKANGIDPYSDNLLICMQPIMPNDAEEYVTELSGAVKDVA